MKWNRRGSGDSEKAVTAIERPSISTTPQSLVDAEESGNADDHVAYCDLFGPIGRAVMRWTRAGTAGAAARA
jgi:hypothetical protein